jgi:hypothetical protein
VLGQNGEMMVPPLITYLMQELPQTHVATAVIRDVDLADTNLVFALWIHHSTNTHKKLSNTSSLHGLDSRIYVRLH